MSSQGKRRGVIGDGKKIFAMRFSAALSLETSEPCVNLIGAQAIRCGLADDYPGANQLFTLGAACS